MNRSKKIGTSFETAVCRYMRDALQDDRIERRALHGSRDMGDIYGITAHGFRGIVECKASAVKWNQFVAIQTWRVQALAERANADADFAVLVVKVPKHGTADAVCHVTIRDLSRIAGATSRWRSVAAGDGDGAWVRMSLEECCCLMGGAV